LNVTDGMVHKTPISRVFHRYLGGQTTPSVAITAGDRTVTFTSTASFDIGDTIYIEEGMVFELTPLHIEDIVGSVITVNRPIDNNYTTSADIYEISTNMAVDGSTPISFVVHPPAGMIWQITRLILTITDGAAMDDGKFGSLSPLANGVLIRAHRGGLLATGTSWVTNGDIATDMYDVTYTDKAPAGENGLRGRWTLTKLGAILELNGDDNDSIEVMIQDNLSTLTSFTMKAQGRIFGF